MKLKEEICLLGHEVLKTKVEKAECRREKKDYSHVQIN
jgi:hypothetical protein